MPHGAAEADEQTKDVFAAGEVVDTVLLGAILPYSKKINVPVMMAMGKDPAFCGLTAPDCGTAESLRRAETPCYAPDVNLETFVLPSYGHSLNFAPDAPRYHAAVTAWADSIIR